MAGLSRLAPAKASFGIPVVCAAGILLVCLAAGGGGKPAVLSEAALELIAIGFLAMCLALPGRLLGDRPLDRTVVWGWTLLAALMIAYLIPLPFSVWSSLPGREVVAQNARLNSSPVALPLSLSPSDTLAALLGLLVPFAAWVAFARLGPRRLPVLLTVLVGFCVLSVLLQALQVTGSPVFYPYGLRHDGFFAGFQANRNAQADLLLAGLAALAALTRTRVRHWAGAVFAVAVAGVLSIGIVLTGSRAGLVLAAIPLAILAWALLALLRRRQPERVVPAVLGLAVLAVSLALLAANSAVVSHALDRFDTLRDARSTVIWPETLFAVRELWPVGSGPGTYIPVFQMFESAELLGPVYWNRAHNDFLEIALETGIVGVALVGVALLWLGVRIVRRLRDKDRETRAGVLFAGQVLVIFALHSLFDYPLRSMAIATVFVMALAFLQEPGEPTFEGIRKS